MKITVALALALLLATPAAFALGGGKKHKKSYTDLNGDGRISRGEWSGDAAKFTALDKNGDNILSGNELRKKGKFHPMDLNGDGRITRDEWRGNDTSFKKHDQNNDRVLSGDELRGLGEKKRKDKV